ncbi:MAG: Hsp70 family protein [Lachnospiraceae bacterium]|nr:Hsp70 family protein [Lachnospiraceae bacterium]
MKYAYGIDLGTTYSCIAYVDEYGKPVVLKNSDGDHTTPSVVMFESAENIIVGMEAKRSIETDPDKTVQFIKRKMGEEKDTIVLNGNTYRAPEVSAYILKKMVRDANKDLQQTGVLQDGEEIKDVVITCPAYFGVNERSATMEAGKLAGLNVLNIINEPTAAAISYGVSGSNKNETVLVYDLGGGTFDITVMNIQGNNISAICTGGDKQLGGKDWDESLMEYVIQRYEEEYGEDLTDDPDAIAALYVDVEIWKKSLTTREKVNISVNGSAGRLREELTRKKYEELTENLLNRTRNLLDETLKQAEQSGCSRENINRILLVGGSSRMPQVSAMLEKHYQITPVLADPDEAVAKGAAIYAGNEKMYHDFIGKEAERTGKSLEEIQNENLVTGSIDKAFARATGGASQKISITNVLSRTYGTAAYEGNEEKIVNMLMINDKLPASNTAIFQTREDNQDGAVLDIYESRSTSEVTDIEDKKPLTSIYMKFQRSVPKGTDIQTTMALDNAGVLHIIAEEERYHSKLDTTFQLTGQMSDTELKDAQKRMSLANIE